MSQDESQTSGRGRHEEESEFVDKLVHINRVAKVVKGGRRFGFAALVVVGDQKGRVGYGHGKAREVPEAIRKASDSAKRNMMFVPLRDGRTLHHDVNGRHGAGKVVLRSAPPGTGIIAGGPMRAVFETLGMSDVVAKSIGSSNPYNMVRATFKALERQTHPKDIALKRNIKYPVLQSRRRDLIGSSDGGRPASATATAAVTATTTASATEAASTSLVPEVTDSAPSSDISDSSSASTVTPDSASTSTPSESDKVDKVDTVVSDGGSNG